MSTRSQVLVDTSVWSLALRRKRKELSQSERALVVALGDLIRDGRSVLIGPVRQEILSGIDDPVTFDRLREYLRDFEDESVMVEDFEDGARLFNQCSSSGIAATSVDMMICAIASRLNLFILTTDLDFSRYSRIFPVRLLTADQLALALKQIREEEV